MHLKNTALTILNQINHLLQQLSEDEFRSSLDLLSNNSIGKHVRHVLEFFDLLVLGNFDGEINYDNRNHDELLESHIEVARRKIDELSANLKNLNADQDIHLKVSYSMSGENSHMVRTSTNRELAYNIEHAIHHMAIIKIAVKTVLPHVKMSDDFGVAYSTMRYQNSGS